MHHHWPKASPLPRQLLAVALFAFASNLSAVAWAREDAPGFLPAEAPRTALSPGQMHALSLLSDVRPPSPASLLLFTDPNKDPDDLGVLVLASALQQQGLLDLRCVVTTLGDRPTRIRRARFAKDVLEDLGLEAVRVAAGLDYGLEVRDGEGAPDPKATEARRKDHQVFIESPLGQPQGALETDALALIEAELAQVPDGSAVLLVNAGMADLAELLRAAPEVVRQKTAKVVIMGGVDPKEDERGFVSADERAYNNTTDQPSADYAYERLQELGVPLVVVTKEAAYGAAAPRGFYEGMAATGNPIGVYLWDKQKASLRALWTGIHEGHLPPALTPEWFFETFTDLDPSSPAGRATHARAEENPGDFEALWQQVTKVTLYDPLALLAATPGVGERLFHGELPAGSRGEVTVMDADAIRDPALVKDLMSGLGIQGLSR